MDLEPITHLGRARLALEVLRTYPAALRELRTNDLNRMVAEARNVPGNGAGVAADLEHPLAIRLGRAVTLTTKLLPTDHRCLIQSLVLTRMLSRRSIENTVVIGVQPGEAFEAHAWVEHHGRAVLPPRNFHRLHEL